MKFAFPRQISCLARFFDSAIPFASLLLWCFCFALQGRLYSETDNVPVPPDENWRPFDLDRDGRLNEQEFKAFEAANAAQKSKKDAAPVFSPDPARNERILKVLQKFDHDADGRWSETEYRIFKDYSKANDFEFLYDSDLNGKLDSKERRRKNEEIDQCEKLFRPAKR